MKKIAVVTATRAEYGLLAPVIRELRSYESDTLKVDLIVTGTHLSSQYGNTVREIEKDGFRIDYRIPVSVGSENAADISENQADVLLKFTRVFMEEKYRAVLLLGDRYETLAIAIAAGNTRTPIFHLCGGDTTQGAIDEWIRHSITKISYLHFVTNEDSRRRVIQMGEDPDRVYNFGSTSIDNIRNISLMSKREALQRIGLADCRYAVCTYHPVTLEENSLEKQIRDFLEAIRRFPEIEFIITKSNADEGGARINEMMDREEKNIKNMHLFTSLGIIGYLSLMKYAEFILGNSSSGIIEAPALQRPVVNIGDRQKGRLQAECIINCSPDLESIINAIGFARSGEMERLCKRTISPYGNGHAAERIAQKCFEVAGGKRIDLKKKFWIGVGEHEKALR
ncbi:UDP-N-acetylglucosamine 2-epimerase (hydrolyzing) [Clostridiaceae bacterium]|nr:UDP-N-acetylglucosamine 2-epimerase (hydrolyzing) [Clostridiaceae bacterium]